MQACHMMSLMFKELSAWNGIGIKSILVSMIPWKWFSLARGMLELATE